MQMQAPMYPPQIPHSIDHQKSDVPFNFDAPKVIRSQGKMHISEAVSQLSMRVTVLENIVQAQQSQPQKEFDLNGDNTISTLLSTIVSRLDKLDKNTPSNVSNLILDMQREMEYVKQIISLLQQQQQQQQPSSSSSNLVDDQEDGLELDPNTNTTTNNDERQEKEEDNMDEFININDGNPSDSSNNSVMDFSPSLYMPFGR